MLWQHCKAGLRQRGAVLTVKDVEIIRRVAEPCEREGLGRSAALCGDSQTHVDVPLPSALLVPDPNQRWPPSAAPTPGSCVAPTVRGEVVAHILTQAHSPGALLKPVHYGVAELAAAACGETHHHSPAAGPAPHSRPGVGHRHPLLYANPP